MRICQNQIQKPVLLLLPLLRSDDLRIEAGEVLVDLVLAVVCGFLCSRESQQSEHSYFLQVRILDFSPFDPCMPAARFQGWRILLLLDLKMPSNLR
jgi:hypothetical protein